MSTTFGTIKVAQPAWRQRAFALFNRYRDAFRSRRQRAQLQAVLFSLDDRDLHDIGIARAEIDYVAAEGAAGRDPRYVGPPAADAGESG
ncbi:MAG TPA: DUF1127 domain-containing protein [Bradyrhizobium sp.]|nr:DUF1127 domain-containing protein [Bradyrhizobium sp.]